MIHMNIKTVHSLYIIYYLFISSCAHEILIIEVTGINAMDARMLSSSLLQCEFSISIMLSVVSIVLTSLQAVVSCLYVVHAIM